MRFSNERKNQIISEFKEFENDLNYFKFFVDEEFSFEDFKTHLNKKGYEWLFHQITSVKDALFLEFRMELRNCFRNKKYNNSPFAIFAMPGYKKDVYSIIVENVSREQWIQTVMKQIQYLKQNSEFVEETVTACYPSGYFGRNPSEIIPLLSELGWTENEKLGPKQYLRGDIKQEPVYMGGQPIRHYQDITFSLK